MLLVKLQMDARLSLAWSHYITYSLQLSSVRACFMRPDSLYTDVAVNTCCQCLNKNFPYHHVYQDKCVARYILLPELILAEHGKCHLCFLKGLFWSPHLAFKNTEHGWIDPDAFSNRSHGNMENSFILPSIILFQRYSDKEQEIPSIFLFWTNCMQHKKKNQISYYRNCLNPMMLKNFWDVRSHFLLIVSFSKTIRAKSCKHLRLRNMMLVLISELCVCISNTQHTWTIAIIPGCKQYIYSAPLQILP